MFSKHAVNKWCNNQRIPGKKEMLRIVEITNRKVLPNDFYLGDWQTHLIYPEWVNVCSRIELGL